MSLWGCFCCPYQVAIVLAEVPLLSVCAGLVLRLRRSKHLACVAGLWSQVKRAPKAKQARKVFEVDGPARTGAMALDDRARQLFGYFKKYNYEVKETGEVIRFVGNYKASRGQAAALVFYVFCGAPWARRAGCLASGRAGRGSG